MWNVVTFSMAITHCVVLINSYYLRVLFKFRVTLKIISSRDFFTARIT